MAKRVSYQIRRWYDHGTLTWELWRITLRTFFPFWRVRQEKLSEYDSEIRAKSAMKQHCSPHYEQVDSYDDTGKPALHGWG